MLRNTVAIGTVPSEGVSPLGETWSERGMVRQCSLLSLFAPSFHFLPSLLQGSWLTEAVSYACNRVVMETVSTLSLGFLSLPISPSFSEACCHGKTYNLLKLWELLLFCSEFCNGRVGIFISLKTTLAGEKSGQKVLCLNFEVFLAATMQKKRVGERIWEPTRHSQKNQISLGREGAPMDPGVSQAVCVKRACIWCWKVQLLEWALLQTVWSCVPASSMILHGILGCENEIELCSCCGAMKGLLLPASVEKQTHINTSIVSWVSNCFLWNVFEQALEFKS